MRYRSDTKDFRSITVRIGKSNRRWLQIRSRQECRSIAAIVDDILSERRSDDEAARQKTKERK
jgi:hypothetical protein